MLIKLVDVIMNVVGGLMGHRLRGPSKKKRNKILLCFRWCGSGDENEDVFVTSPAMSLW